MTLTPEQNAKWIQLQARWMSAMLIACNGTQGNLVDHVEEEICDALDAFAETLDSTSEDAGA